MSTRSKKTQTSGKAVLGREAFAAISAVEGLKLGREGQRRLSDMDRRNLSGEERRAEVIRAYTGSKKQ